MKNLFFNIFLVLLMLILTFLLILPLKYFNIIKKEKFSNIQETQNKYACLYAYYEKNDII